MSHNPQDQINDWYDAIDINQRGYLASSRRLDGYHRVIGIVIFISSAVAGITLLVGIENLYLRSLAGALGLIAAILAGIQTFYSHAKRSERYWAAATQLGQLLGEIEELEKLPPQYLKAQNETFLQVNHRLENIKRSAPPIHSQLVRQIREENQSSDMLLKKLKRNDLLTE